MIEDTEIEAVICEITGLILGRTVAFEDHVSQDNEPSWDSLKHVELVIAVEDDLEVRFDEDELAELTSVDRLVAAVRRHRAA